MSLTSCNLCLRDNGEIFPDETLKYFPCQYLCSNQYKAKNSLIYSNYYLPLLEEGYPAIYDQKA